MASENGDVMEGPGKPQDCQVEGCRQLATAHVYQDSKDFWVCDVHMKCIMRVLKLRIRWGKGERL
jgi:hypothetical protein